MVGKRPLWLHEEIMLLSLRDKEGTIGFNLNYQPALGGAIAAELLLAGRITAEDTKKKLVNLVSDVPLGDPVIDECLAMIAAAGRRAALRTWVTRFAGLKNLKGRVAEGLSRRGILRVDEDQVLLIFRRKIYPQVDPKPERELVARLRRAIFGGSRKLDPRTVILIALANSANILKEHFDKERLKERKERLKQISRGEMIGKATKDAIAAMQAAVIVAVIMPGVVAGGR